MIPQIFQFPMNLFYANVATSNHYDSTTFIVRIIFYTTTGGRKGAKGLKPH